MPFSTIEMLSSTNVVPSGIVSFTVTSFAKSPSFLIVIVYVIFSPSTTYANPFSVSADLLPEIIDSTYVCVISFVGSSSTVAMFLIGVPFSMSFTVTLNSTFFVSPTFKSTFIPLAKSSTVLPVVVSPTLMLPVTKLVPVGIVSFTFTVVGAVPVLLSNVM